VVLGFLRKLTWTNGVPACRGRKEEASGNLYERGKGEKGVKLLKNRGGGGLNLTVELKMGPRQGSLNGVITIKRGKDVKREISVVKSLSGA